MHQLILQIAVQAKVEAIFHQSGALFIQLSNGAL